MGKRKKKSIYILKIVSLLIGLGMLSATTYYSLNYMHWKAKSGGYPGLYTQKKEYPFLRAQLDLMNAKWEDLASDHQNDSDIPGWPDAETLAYAFVNDTLWFRYKLFNNIDLNEPMVSIALEDTEGHSWYGTVDFKYGEMIAAGYYRSGETYLGYNYVGKEIGVLSFRFDLKTDALFLGIPKRYLNKFLNSKFVASVGYKGLWSDDFTNKIAIEVHPDQ